MTLSGGTLRRVERPDCSANQGDLRRRIVRVPRKVRQIRIGSLVEQSDVPE